MVEIRKIVRKSTLSNFQQPGPNRGLGFAALADMAKTAYDVFAPAAIEEQTQEGAARGREAARQEMANSRIPLNIPAAGGGQRAEPSGEHGTTIEYELQGKKRPNPPDARLNNVVGSAAESVFGKGAKVVIYSGQENEGHQHGSNRHKTGLAGDMRIYDASGKQVELSDPRAKDFMREATRMGAQGIGAGEEYMGDAFHIDLIPPSELSAGQDSGWGSLGNQMQAELDTIRVGSDGKLTGGKFGGEPSDPVVMAPEGSQIRNDAGETELRRYSPLSGPILRAHDAASDVAYVSEKVTMGLEDIMSLSVNNEFDPSTFKAAAESYVEEAVKAAPDMLKETIRAELGGEVSKRFLGLVDKQQAEVRKRANNSSAALMTRYQKDLAQALASGDVAEAESVRGALEGVLQAREALPGVAWTREQSENVMIDAFDTAEKLRSAEMKKQMSDEEDRLNTVISALDGGRTSVDEAMVSDPEIAARHPELAREAAAKMILRDQIPGFHAMTPTQRKEVIQNEASQKIAEQWEMDILKAMVDADKAATKAVEDDPLVYADQYLDNKPPELPVDLSDPDAFMRGLAGRREYGNDLARQGYTETPQYFSNAERTAIKGIIGPEADIGAKAAFSAAIVQGFGRDAGRAMQEIGADEVLTMTAQVTAAGGDPTIARDALVGQSLIDQKLVDMPSNATSLQGFSDAIHEAVPEIPNLRGPLMKTAKAIYASQARGVDPKSDEAITLMESSVQRALGQTTNRRGKMIGGVQKINGSSVLLPPGVSGEALEGQMRRALGSGAPDAGFIRRSIVTDVEPVPGMWGDAGVPQWNGRDLNLSDLNSTRLVPHVDQAGNVVTGFYRMEMVMNGAVTDTVDQNGSLYLFNIQDMIGN